MSRPMVLRLCRTTRTWRRRGSRLIEFGASHRRRHCSTFSSKKMTRKMRNRMGRYKLERSPFKYAAIFGLSSAAIFGLCSLIFHFGDWVRLGVVSALGLFAGILAAPEFEPKHFTSPIVWRTISGGIFAFILSLVINPSGDYMLVFTVSGALLGATASLWLKHLQIP
jgi:hypothetical protein